MEQLERKIKIMESNSKKIKKKVEELMALGYDGMVICGIIRDDEGNRCVDTNLVDVCTHCDLTNVIHSISEYVTEDCDPDSDTENNGKVIRRIDPSKN